MLEKLKKLDVLLVLLLALGARSLIDSNIAQAMVVMAFCGLYGYTKFLRSKEVVPLNEEVQRQLEEMRSTVSGLAMKNASKPDQMKNEVRRFF